MSFQAEAPCQGDAFSFRVTIHELWTRPGESNALELAVSERIKAQHLAVERRLRDISRRFPPEATADFECEVNAELGSPVRFSDDLDLECSFSIHVASDEELNHHLRNAEIKRLQAQADHAQKDQHLNHLNVMRDRWLIFLGQFDGDPLGSLAAQLASDPDQLPDVIGKRTSESERLTNELRKLCDTTSEAYRDKDLFDFVNTTDSALSRLLRHMGIDGAPEPDGGVVRGMGEAGNGAGPPRE
ncbi:MAG: hypothetical protein ACR2MP_12160 [Streptosporangiaceae bacterium]